MPWLARHNPEIDWKTGEVQMMRCLEKCEKKWRVGKQTKPGWKKQEKQEEKKKKRKKEKKETDNRESKNDRKNNGRKGGRRGRFDRVKSNK